MSVTPKTQKHIWGLFAARCAICREHLIHEVSGTVRSLVGEIAHNVGEKSTAARGKNVLPMDQRDEPDNLLLLCLNHHKIIDDNEGEYPVERIQAIRDDYLTWLRDQLEPSRPWTIAIGSFAYLNVPRLGELAAIAGYRVNGPVIAENQTLHDLGIELTRLMVAFRATLEGVGPRGVPVSSIAFAHEGYIGQLVTFDALKFRTKNIPATRPRTAHYDFSGEPDIDPHIYHRAGEWTLVLNINPRWVTTDTAYCMFRPSGGVSVFSGFARITGVDYDTGRMTGTALAIGTPLGLFDLSRSSSQPTGPVQAAPDLSSLEDEVTTSRGDEWISELENCDLCGRLFAYETYMVDGGVKGSSGWACMCARCFSSRGVGLLGIGKGQLYRREGARWLLVGGYPRRDDQEQF